MKRVKTKQSQSKTVSVLLEMRKGATLPQRLAIDNAIKVMDKEPARITELVLNSNYVALACVIRTLKFEFGFGEKRLMRFVDSYAALVNEMAGRSNPRLMVDDCKALTGYDAKNIIDKAFEKEGLLI